MTEEVVLEEPPAAPEGDDSKAAVGAELTPEQLAELEPPNEPQPDAA